MEQTKFTLRKAQTIFRLKVDDADIHEKHHLEKFQLIADSIKRGNEKSGIFYDSLTKLYIKQIKELANMYTNSCLESITKSKSINDEIKNEIIKTVRMFVDSTYQNKKAELRGIFANNNISSNIVSETFLKKFEWKRHKLIQYITDKITIEIGDRNELLVNIAENTINEISSKHLLAQPDDNAEKIKISPDVPIQIPEQPAKKLRISNQIKLIVQNIAKAQWEHEILSNKPLTSIKEMFKKKKLQFERIAIEKRIHKQEPYSERKIMEWLSEVTPAEYKKRGRKTKNN